MYNRTDKNIVSHKSNKRKHEITGTPIHTSRGKVIGQVKGDVFEKDIITKWILDRPFPSIASDICTLHEAESAGAVYVEFTNTDDGVTYRSPIAKFWDCGKFINYGFGDQQTLGLEHFEHRRDPNATSHTSTEPPTYSESGTTDTTPLHYRSKAITGTHFTDTGKKTPKQLRLFGNGGQYG